MGIFNDWWRFKRFPEIFHFLAENVMDGLYNSRRKYNSLCNFAYSRLKVTFSNFLYFCLFCTGVFNI